MVTRPTACASLWCKCSLFKLQPDCPTVESYQQSFDMPLLHTPLSCVAQAVAVCASETRVGGAYIAVVAEAAAALPEVPDVEEEAQLADEAPIAPPGNCLLVMPCLANTLTNLAV